MDEEKQITRINTPYITHVAFSGGGMKGICYLGIIRYLYIENLHQNIKYIHGTSIGSYFAIVLALKIPLDFIENEILEILKEFTTNEELAINQKQLHNLFQKNGFFKLKFLLNPIKNYLKKTYDLEDISFIDLVKKTGINLYIPCTNINSGKIKIFNVDDTPNISVFDACVASMSIPFIFEPVKILDDYYIDGDVSYIDRDNIFENIDENCILNVILSNTDTIEITENEADTEYPFMEYSIRVMMLFFTKVLTIYKLNANSDSKKCLNIREFPCKSILNFKSNNENEIRIYVTDHDFENLILLGFVEITNYMQRNYVMNNTI